MQKRLIWFRNDLRLRDNRTLSTAVEGACEVAGIYFLKSTSEKPQDQFLLQTLKNLKRDLAALQIPLFIMKLKSNHSVEASTIIAEILRAILKSEGFDKLYWTAEENDRDRKLELEVTQLLPAEVVQSIAQRTLLEKDELPFALDQLPMIFTNFRKTVEAHWRVRAEVAAPKILSKKLSKVLPKAPRMESLENLEFESAELFDIDTAITGESLAYEIKGGEEFGLERLKDYFWDTHAVKTYYETRNGLLNKNDSSKFSCWLANGSLSPRTIYFELKNYEAQFGANKSTYWLIFELLWRDYFKFLASKLEHRLFQSQGLASVPVNWSENQEVFRAWCQGETGVDFVDASMRELLATGWMSNRGRQNVASYLSKTCQIDWTWGAKWFAENLIDLDTESNWGNWLYLAGVGTDPRDRKFNIQRQAQLYDPDRSYQNKWLKTNHEN